MKAVQACGLVLGQVSSRLIRLCCEAILIIVCRFANVFDHIWRIQDKVSDIKKGY